MIRVHGLSKSYGGTRPVLQDVSLRVRDGEFCALTGPSGSGKTTLFRILVGELAPDAGTVVIGGRNLGRLDSSGIAELRRELGLVFDTPRLIEGLPVLDNVALAAEVRGRSRAEARRLAEEALEKVELDDASGCFARDLCAAEKQKASLARALVNGPSLILADEPTVGLDPDQALFVVRVLAEACREGATVLMATHDMEALSAMQGRGRVMVINRGRLSDEAALEELCA